MNDYRPTMYCPYCGTLLMLEIHLDTDSLLTRKRKEIDCETCGTTIVYGYELYVRIIEVKKSTEI